MTREFYSLEPIDLEAVHESFGYTETHRESTPAGEMVFYEKPLVE